MDNETKEKIEQTASKVASFIWDTARDLTVIAASTVAEVANYVKEKAQRNND
jgi:CheY-specific phosphatase CheX